jgi:hypothetical protein
MSQIRLGETTTSHIHAGPDCGSPTSTPRWAKVFGIVALALVLLSGILRFTGVGGHHGPGRHMPSGGAGDAPPASVTVDRIPPAVAMVATHRPKITEMQQP